MVSTSLSSASPGTLKAHESNNDNDNDNDKLYPSRIELALNRPSLRSHSLIEKFGFIHSKTLLGCRLLNEPLDQALAKDDSGKINLHPHLQIDLSQSLHFDLGILHHTAPFSYFRFDKVSKFFRAITPVLVAHLQAMGFGCR